MIEDLDKRQPLICFINEYFIYQILIFLRQPWFKPDLASHDLVANLPWMHSCERSSAMHQLVKQDTERPYIKRVIVILVLDHLRGHVLQRAAERVSLLHVVSLYAPPKITNLNDISIFDKDIFRLDIPMDESLLVKIIDTRTNLNEEIECSVLAQKLLLPYEIEQIAFGSIFKGQIYCRLIFETGVQSTYIFVIQLFLYTDFSN